MKREVSAGRSFLETMKRSPANQALLDDVKALEGALKQMADQQYKPDLIRERRQAGIQELVLRHGQRLRQDREKAAAALDTLKTRLHEERLRDPAFQTRHEDKRLRWAALSGTELKRAAEAFMTGQADLDPDDVRLLSAELKAAAPKEHEAFRAYVQKARAEEAHLRTPEGRDLERRLRFLSVPEGTFGISEGGADEYDLTSTAPIADLID